MCLDYPTIVYGSGAIVEYLIQILSKIPKYLQLFI